MTANIRKILWASFALSLMASVSHLAWTFSTMEFDEWYSGLAGWGAALSIDLGMIGLSQMMEFKKKKGKPYKNYRYGMWVFGFLSFFGNMVHDLSAIFGPDLQIPYGWLSGFQILKSVLMGGSLPILAIYLGEMLAATTPPAPRNRKQSESTENNGPETKMEIPKELMENPEKFNSVISLPNAMEKNRERKARSADPVSQQKFMF